MKFGSLFSGIGGLDLGLERAGFECAWMVENAPYSRRVLDKHWPQVPKFGDIREVRPHELPAVDLVCGGFPCQDLSHAGKRAGLNGERSGLWREFCRIVADLKPRFILVENVHHAWRSWMPSVRGDLWGLGYASLPLRLSASEVGADHERRRGFVLANPDGEFLRELSRRWIGASGEVAAEPLDSRWGTAASRMARIDDGVPYGVDRRRALGNAVVPQVAQWIGERILEVSA